MRRILLVAVVGLTACGGAQLKSSLQDLRNSDPAKRLAAARYLINNGGGKVYPQILEVLKDDFPENRLTAVYCLAHLKDPRSIPYFVSAANEDKDKMVRQTAVDALGLYGPKGMEALREIISPGHKPSSRARAVQILGNMGEAAGAYDLFSELAQKENAPEEVRASAAHRLGCLKDPRAEKVLTQIVDNEGYPSSVRCGAAYGLVGLFMTTSDKSVTSPLFDRLRGGATTAEVRSCAAEAYSELYEPTNLAKYCSIHSFIEVPTLSDFDQ